MLQYLVEQQRIVRAAEYYRVDVRVEAHQGVDALLYKVVGTRRVVLVVLYQRHPQRAGHAGDADVGIEFLYLEYVALALYRALGGQYAHVARLRNRTYALGRGTYHAEHAACGVEHGQVVLLYGTQSLGRGRVAGQDDKVAAHREQFYHGLARKLVHHVERARPVGGACVVAEVQVVVLR